MDRDDPRSAKADAALHWAVSHLADTAPHLSARRVLTGPQVAALLGIAAAIAAVAIVAPAEEFLAWEIVAFTLFAAAILIRAAAAIASLAPSRAPEPAHGPLPRYAVFVALRDEAAIVPDLLAALARLEYPADRLDVVLILEADDDTTIAAVNAALTARPGFARALITPVASPRTKPKALNFALAHSDAEFVCVFDAEDRPHPQQLRAALAAFQAGGSRLGCVQAPLLTDNSKSSWIAAQFAAEYAIHFHQLVPLLARLNLPLPLGGTSNHFRRSALDHVGGWDPYNVTEDADLGYRLARFGYRCGAIAPATMEEAPASLRGWSRQRTRWIKGHIQSWLVLMRQPADTIRTLGWRGFAAMQLVLGAAIVSPLLHAPLLALLTFAALTPGSQLGLVHWGLAVSGYGVAFAASLCAAFTTRRPSIAVTGLTMPLYWPLSLWPALCALFELGTKPHYWAKTTHALTAREPSP